MTSTLTSPPTAARAATALSVMRMFAGTYSWASPRHAWRLFGLGPMTADGSSGLVSRLFGVRDLLLALGVHHSDASVRRTVLRAGVAIDAADVAATMLAVRAGAPKSALLGVAAGAGLFITLGLTALGGSK